MKNRIFYKYLNHDLILIVLINNLNIISTIFHEIKNDVYHQCLINCDAFIMMKNLISAFKS
jgi:hypothetical protein